MSRIKKSMTDDEADRMMIDVSDAICADDPARAAEALEYMAHEMHLVFGRRGERFFNDMRNHLIQYTIDRLGRAAAPLIQLTLQLAEQELMRKRSFRQKRNISGVLNGNSNIIIN